MNAHTKIAGDSDDTFRHGHVGASEVATLFDASPFLTRFELWHRKAGNIATPDFGGNERIEAGIRLEPVIIDWACDKWGYTRLETPRRLDNGKGLGGHPDQVVMCPRRGKGVLEVKTADWLVAKKWGDEPPLHYLLQNQAYQGLLGVEWGDVIVLVGGNEMRRFEYQFRPVIFDDMEARVVEFWRSVRDGMPPAPDYSRDGATLIESIGAPDDGFADLREDGEADQWAHDFAAAKVRAKAAEAEAEIARCKLIERIGTAGSALLPAHRLTANMTKGTPDREAVPGEIIKGRKGYRRFDLKEIA